MTATGSSIERTIWNFFIIKGLSPAGVAGLMGNLYDESGLNPQNLQNTFEKRLDFTDAAYTAAVDSGSYSNFVHDGAGYGLAQWTYWSRKEAMLNHAKKLGTSIGDLEMQLDFILQELKQYAAVYQILRTARTVKEASDIVLTRYEQPANMGSSVKARRASFGQAFFDAYARPSNASTPKEETDMSNSPLVDYTKISPNRSSPRSGKISKITIHHMAGNLSVEACANVFTTTDRQASSNYGIGTDGRVGLYVEEKDRAWTSSNRDNDNVAVTIEVANDGGAPDWHVSDQALTKTIDLCVDICQRNGISRLNFTGDESGNLTMHKYFAATACPGPYLEGKFQHIADEVNARLSAAETPAPPSVEVAPETSMGLTIGEEVDFTGTRHYFSAYAATGPSCQPGRAKVTAVHSTGRHKVHLIAVPGGGSTVYGWVDLDDIARSAPAETWTPCVGDVVNFNGSKHYTSANASSGLSCRPGMAVITVIHEPDTSKHPYHLVRVKGRGSTVYGWVDAGTFKKA